MVLRPECDLCMFEMRIGKAIQVELAFMRCLDFTLRGSHICESFGCQKHPAPAMGDTAPAKQATAPSIIREKPASLMRN